VDDGLRVEVITNASDPPAFDTFTLADPERLVLQLPGFRFDLKALGTLQVGRAGVKRIRLGQYRARPPLARIVFDLSVPAGTLRYRTVSSPGEGRLSLEFSPPSGAPQPTAPPAAAARPLAPPPEAAPQPSPPTPEPTVEPAPPPQPTAAEPRPAPAPRPEPAPPEALAPPAPPPPRPTAYRGGLPVAWVLVPLFAAAALIFAGLWLRDRVEARRAESRTLEALRSEDPAERLRALDALEGRPAAELQGLAHLLLAAGEDASEEVAAKAAEMLRTAFPLDSLTALLASESVESKLQAVRILALHPAHAASELLFEAALAGPDAVSRPAVAALAEQARGGALGEALTALCFKDEARRGLARKIVEAAGRGAAPVLRSALSAPDEHARRGGIAGLVLLATEGSAKAISHLLSDPVAQVRADAARALGLLGANGAHRDQLLSALDDPAADVRLAAAEALARLGGDQVDALLDALTDEEKRPDVPVSASLLDAVGQGCERPSPALARALSASSRELASGLARSLERAGRLDAWLELAIGEPSDERDLILSVLRAAGGAGAAEPLLRGLARPDPATQEACARLLGDAGEQTAVEGLARLLSAPEESLRAAAAEGLGKLHSDEAVSALLQAVEDPVVAVREAAARALAQALSSRGGDEPTSGGDEALRDSVIRALTKSLEDPAREVRTAAVLALGALGVPEAAPSLTELALGDCEADLREAAIAGLAKLAAGEVPPSLRRAVEDPNPDVRIRAIEMLVAIGDAVATDVLVGLLADDDEAVRQAAGRALWEIASEGRVQGLLPYLKSPDPKVRCAIAGVLGKVGAVECAGALAAAGADPDPYVRASVVNAFRRLGEEANYYLDTVIARTADADAYVRARALEALAAIAPDSTDVASHHLSLTADPDPEVRKAAASCLLSYAERGVCEPLVDLLSDVMRRPQALETLQVADEAVLRKVLAAVQQRPADVARAAAETLSYVLSRRWTVEDFRADLDSLDPKARLAGLEGLALVGSAEAVAEMCRLLKTDPAPELRRRTVEILMPFSAPAAQDAVRIAAEQDPDSEVRHAAMAALAQAPENGSPA